MVESSKRIFLEEVRVVAVVLGSTDKLRHVGTLRRIRRGPVHVCRKQRTHVEGVARGGTRGNRLKGRRGALGWAEV